MTTLTSLLLILLLPLLAPLPLLTHGQSGENFSQILQDLPTIDKRIRPVRNATTRTVVDVSFHLMSILKFDTVEQKLVSSGWFSVMWDNEYTTWNPFLYMNAYVVPGDPEKVWRPMLAVQNTMKDMKPIGEDYIVMLILFNGTTYWYPAERFETFCAVDVTYFPFDSQKCRWTVFVWGGDWSSIDLRPIRDKIDLGFYTINGEWDLRESRAWRTVALMNGLQFITLEHEVTLQRRPSLLALTVLLPVLVVAVVNVYVFTIPSEAGERLAYSMTALLSFGVFMSFIMDAMPSSTQTLSIVAVNMSCLLVLSALYVLLCILSLRLFHRDSSKHPVPPSLQNVIVWAEILVCLDPPSRNKVVDIYHIPRPLLTTDLPADDQTRMVGAQDGGLAMVVNGGGSKLQAQLDKWARARSKNHAAYADPAEMTWRRVSRTLDKLLFRFFLLLVIVSNIAVWMVLVVNYYS